LERCAAGQHLASDCDLLEGLPVLDIDPEHLEPVVTIVEKIGGVR
jgi:hypothetical protein